MGLTRPKVGAALARGRHEDGHDAVVLGHDHVDDQSAVWKNVNVIGVVVDGAIGRFVNATAAVTPTLTTRGGVGPFARLPCYGGLHF